MKPTSLALLAIFCIGAAQTASADDAGLLRCRAITEAGARLSCYDSLQLGAPARPTAPSAGVAPGAATATPGATTAAPRPNNDFGLQGTSAAEIKFIESHINGRFTGWDPAQLITLDNGQVWRIADGSSAYFEATNPKVRIERGMFTAFFMVVAGLNHTPRVQRVK